MAGIASAHAQQVPDQVAPGRAEKQFKEFKVPQFDTREFVPGQRDISPPPGSEAIKFVLRDLSFEGVAVFGDDQLRSLYAGFVGQTISLEELYSIANKITTYYRNNGYVLSQAIVPEQEITEAGRAVLRVVEGYIASVGIQGADGPLETSVRRFLDKVPDSRPLRARDLERYMLLANDLPGIEGRATIQPSSSATGAADLNVAVFPDKVSGFVGITNRGSEFQGPFQVSAQLESFDNLGGSHGAWRLFGVSTISNELNYLSLSRHQFLGSEGFAVAASLSATQTEPGGALSQTNIETDTVTANVTASYPLIRSRARNWTVRTTFTVHDGEKEQPVPDDAIAVDPTLDLDTEDRVRSIRFGTSYDFLDRLRGVSLIDVELSQGLDILDATETGSANLSRPNGKSDYTKLAIAAARVQSLFPGWSLLAAIDAQITDDDLLSSEQFGIGGANFGRGHDASEIVGDEGIAGKLELRRTAASAWTWLDEYVLYGFLDGGEVRRETPGNGQEKDESLSSYGFGVRFKAWRRFSGYLEFADPITHIVSAEGDKDPRVFFSLTGEY